MIIANELRLGNWVACEGKAYQVNINILQSFTVSPVWMDPIPITPEILEKAGFKKDGPCHVLTSRRDQTAFSIGFDGSVLNVFDHGFESYQGVILLHKDSKYVHQLQNLYFSLTGEELKIEL